MLGPPSQGSCEPRFVQVGPRDDPRSELEGQFSFYKKNVGAPGARQNDSAVTAASRHSTTQRLLQREGSFLSPPSPRSMLGPPSHRSCEPRFVQVGPRDDLRSELESQFSFCKKNVSAPGARQNDDWQTMLRDSLSELRERCFVLSSRITPVLSELRNEGDHGNLQSCDPAIPTPGCGSPDHAPPAPQMVGEEGPRNRCCRGYQECAFQKLCQDVANKIATSKTLKFHNVRKTAAFDNKVAFCVEESLKRDAVASGSEARYVPVEWS